MIENLETSPVRLAVDDALNDILLSVLVLTGDLNFALLP